MLVGGGVRGCSLDGYTTINPINHGWHRLPTQKHFASTQRIPHTTKMELNNGPCAMDRKQRASASLINSKGGMGNGYRVMNMSSSPFKSVLFGTG